MGLVNMINLNLVTHNDALYKCKEDTYATEFASKYDAWKTCLLVRKLGTVEYDRFTNFILPRQNKDSDFIQTVKQPSEIFGELLSLFSVWYHCLKLMKHEADDYVTSFSFVDREWSRLRKISLNTLFLSLDSPGRRFSHLNNEKTSVCQYLRNLKRNTHMAQQAAKSSLNITLKYSKFI